MVATGETRDEGRRDDAPFRPGQLWIWGLAGSAVGAVVVLSAPDRLETDWVTWALLAVGLCGTASVTFLLGWRQWRALSLTAGTWHIRRFATVCVSAATMAVAVLVVGVAIGSGLRGWVLVAFTSAGAGPAIGAAIEAGRVAERPAEIDPIPRLEFLSIVGVILRRLLTAGGALVALSTLALGASLQRPEFADPTDDPLSQVLPFGAAGSAVVALFYVPPAATLRRAVDRELRRLLPLDSTSSPEDLVATLEERHSIRRLVVGERGLYDEVTASLVVLAPLIAAALQRFLG